MLLDQHAAPMSTQLQNEHLASTNRAQFATVNQGRPASLVVSSPLAADQNMRARRRRRCNSSSNSTRQFHSSTRCPSSSDSIRQFHSSTRCPSSSIRPLRRSNSTRRLRNTRPRRNIRQPQNIRRRIIRSNSGHEASAPEPAHGEAKVSNYSAVFIRMAARLRTQRAGRFSPVATSCRGPLSAIGFPSMVSATNTVASCRSGVTSPME